VNVDAAEARNCEHPRREDLAISHNHARIGRDAFKDCAHFVVAFDLCRLMYGYAVFEGEYFYRRLVQMFPSACRFVGLCEDGGDIMAVNYQSL